MMERKANELERPPFPVNPSFRDEALPWLQGFSAAMSVLRDFRLETYFSKWEFTARYNLCASDVQSMALGELLELGEPADREAWEQLHLGYTETFGAPPLREAIAATYEDLSPSELLCFAGAEEGIYVAMHALLGRDDHAVVLIPNYQSLETVAQALCPVTGVSLDPNDAWAFDLDAVRDALRPNTRLVSVNFPHNPTGKLVSRELFDELIGICDERGIYLFSDEVYRMLERDERTRLPQAVDLYHRGLSLGVLSKAYGLPGLRIGWIAGRDRALLSRMERIKHYLSICNSAPSEALAVIALKARSGILERNRALVARNLELLEGFMADHEELFDWYRPDGGCICYPRYRGDDGVEQFAGRLVEQSGVLLLPASVFQSEIGETPTDRFRVGFGRSHTPEAVAAFRDYLDSK
jgi:aspartate/methionine/tyrosine aminotransferase